MLKPKIFIGDSARQTLLDGMNILTDAVQVTLGPCGRNVMIEHMGKLTPVMTKDGLTVASMIKLEHGGQQAGLEYLRHAARKVSSEIGDGTTTTMVMARDMARTFCTGLSSNLDAHEMIQGGTDTIIKILESLEKIRKDNLDFETIAKVATLSANWDSSVGKIIAQAFEAVGSDGTVKIGMGDSRDDQIDLVDGACWDQGFLSSAFATNKTLMRTELSNPLILLYDRTLEHNDEIVPALEIAKANNRPLLVLADGISEEVLTLMKMNHIRGQVQCVAAKPPGYGDTRLEYLEDLAVLTGGKAFMEISGDSIMSVKEKDLGSANSIMVDENEIILIEPGGEQDKRTEHIAGLRLRLETADKETLSPTGREHIKDNLEDRLTLLAAKYAEIKVGASSDTEIRYRVQLFENARNAVRVALKDGILPGGGWALHTACSNLNETIQETKGSSYSYGQEAVLHAIEAPLRCIIWNAGFKPEKVIFEVDQERKNNNWIGYDARNNSVTDLLKAGVIDPYALVRTQLLTAYSIVNLLAKSSGLIARLSSNRIPDIGFNAEQARSSMEQV